MIIVGPLELNYSGLLWFMLCYAMLFYPFNQKRWQLCDKPWAYSSSWQCTCGPQHLSWGTRLEDSLLTGKPEQFLLGWAGLGCMDSVVFTPVLCCTGPWAAGQPQQLIATEEPAGSRAQSLLTEPRVSFSGPKASFSGSNHSFYGPNALFKAQSLIFKVPIFTLESKASFLWPKASLLGIKGSF